MTVIGRELPPAKVEQIPDVDIDGRANLFVIAWDEASSTYVHVSPGASTDTVDGWQAEHPKPDTVTDGAGIEMTVTSRWGVSGGMPYFNPTAVDAGDEASLLRSSVGWTLRPRTVT
jgi:hypothetical protein